MKIIRTEGELITYALGSCIGICFYDPSIQLGGLLHIMLPKAELDSPVSIYKYADTGIAETLPKLQVFGGRRSRLTARIAGGASMFSGQQFSALGNIGQRNIQAVKSILYQSGVRILGEDTGSDYARTMMMDVSNGIVKVKAYGRMELIL